MKGLADRLIEEIDDSLTGQTYEAWDCINDDTFKCKIPNSPKLLYSLNSSGINTNIIINFWDYVEGKRIKLLPSENNIKLEDRENVNVVSAHMRTESLLEQISNLEIETIKGKYRLKRVSTRIDDDIYYSLAYLLYYVQNNENNKVSSNADYFEYIFYN